MKTYSSHKNVRNGRNTLTTSAISRNKTLLNKDDANVIEHFSEYIAQKSKKYNLVSQCKHKPRPEIIHNLLTQTEADKQWADIPKNSIINSHEYNSLCQLYQNGHNEFEKGKRQISSLNKDNDILKSNGIDLSLLNSFKKELKLNKNMQTIGSATNSNINCNQEFITTNHGTGFNSQYDSFKCLNVNQQLIKKIYIKQSKEQINQFISQGLFKEELLLKSSLMPHIRTTMIGRKERLTDGPVNRSPDKTKKIVKSETYNRRSNITLDTLFSQYNILYVAVKSHFTLTPSSRSQMKMVIDIKDPEKEAMMYLYGGINQHRLEELWKCQISPSKDLEKDLVFNWKQELSSSGNSLACSGHSLCIFKDQLIIYGGIVNNQKTINILEDPLFYHIPSKKFSSEKCRKETHQSIWRRNHIGEIIGKHLVIYGGIHEDRGLMNDVWALDVVKYKWTKVPTTTHPPFLYSMASCLVIYSHHKNTEPISLYKLPQLSELLPPSPLKHEGIYIFGGIDSSGKCVNNLFILKIGKPLQLIHPNSSGIPPRPRSDCSMNFFEKLNSFIIHGGKDDSIKGGCYFNDFYFYDIIHFQWTQMKINSFVPLRAEHCSVVYDDFLIVFGGSDGNMFHKSDILMVNLNIVENFHSELNPFELYKPNSKIKTKQGNALTTLPKLTSNNTETTRKFEKEKSCTRTIETQENLPQKYFDHFHFISNQIKQKSSIIKNECQDLRLKNNKRFTVPE